MGEDNKITASIQAVEGVVKAVPIYQDAIQPAAKELGVALTTVAKSVNLALAPVSGLVWGFDKIKEFVISSVVSKLKEVPAENIITPKPEIAGPALEALRYTGYDPDLRELYAKLLATAMDADTAANAHPAFIEIIKNLSSDEAKIMTIFPVPGGFPTIDILSQAGDSNYITEGLLNFSFIGKKAKCVNLHLCPAYLVNLCRMGLIAVDELPHAKGDYEELENDTMLDSVKQKIANSGRYLEIKRRSIWITAWGRQFCRACVIEKKGSAFGSQSSEP